MSFTEESIQSLLNIGIRWYATDEPAKFTKSVQSWLAVENP